MEYKNLEFSDYPLFKEIFSVFPQRLGCFAPASLFAWKNVYQYEWTSCGIGAVVISFQPVEEEERHFFQPLGVFNSAAQERFLKTLEHLGYAAKIFNVGEEFISKHQGFMKHFDVENDPGLANYTYSARDLSVLAGGAYRRKRELIRQAQREYPWAVHPLTAQYRDDCLDILKRWNAEKGDADENGENEIAANLSAIEQLPLFGARGILLTSAEKPIGFSIFEPLNPQTSVIHFEKADREYRGSFEILQREAAKLIAAGGFTLINREEDLGIPGLRQNKLSYRPVEMIPAYILSYRGA